MTNHLPPQRLFALSGEPDWSVLDRYFSNECTPDEADAIARWVAADSSHSDLMAFVRQLWQESGHAVPAIDEDAGWRALSARVHAARGRATAARTPRVAPLTVARTRSRSARAIRAAMAAVGAAAAVALTAVWWTSHRSPESVQLAAAGLDYVTERGQRAEIMLVDGTRVWLSVDSRLHIPTGYGTRARDVELEGEAYFAVQHDDVLPFRVRTAGSISEDLGTEFSVRAYPGDSATAVVVAEGVVALRRAEAPGGAAGTGRDPRRAEAGIRDIGVELTRGQMGRLGPSGKVAVVYGVNVDALQSWREGKLQLDEVPLNRAIVELERWYDVKVTLGDSSLARVPLTATFDNQTVDEAFAVIARALDVRYGRDGRKVRLAASPARR